MNKLTEDLDLHDCWRMKHGNEREYTWSKNQPFTARRLDYIFTSASLIANVEYCEIISIARSDHRAVETGISFHNFKKGPSYWKFNNSLLSDKHFLAQTNQLLREFRKSNKNNASLNAHTKWELCKIKIKEFTISYSKAKTKMKRDKLRDLHLKLTKLEKTPAQQENPELLAEILKVKAELEISSLAAAQGAQTRSRTKFIERGEQNTAYFLNFEKTNAANNTITSITAENSQILLHKMTFLFSKLNSTKSSTRKTPASKTNPTNISPTFLAKTALCHLWRKKTETLVKVE